MANPPGLDLTTATSTIASLSATTSAKAAKKAVSTKARTAAEDFEAVFLNNMFQQMFTGIGGEGPFGGSGAAGVWRSFLTNEYSKTFAKNGGIGIADHVYRSLLQVQEAAAKQ